MGNGCGRAGRRRCDRLVGSGSRREVVSTKSRESSAYGRRGRGHRRRWHHVVRLAWAYVERNAAVVAPVSRLTVLAPLRLILYIVAVILAVDCVRRLVIADVHVT
jgi:hypothetical protein